MSPSCRANVVLAFVHGLLRSPVPSSRTLENLLRELAEAFDVLGAGLAGPLEPVPKVQQHVRRSGAAIGPWPWQQQLQIGSELQPGSTAIGPAWLATLLPDGRLLWLEAEQRDWTEAERDALVAAGLVIGSLHPAGSDLDAAGMLARRLAHSFGNILTGIIGFAELTQMQLPAGSSGRRYLGEILHTAQEGVELTHQLQQFGVAGSQQPGPTALAAVLREEERRLQPLLQKGEHLQVNVPNDLPPLDIARDPLRLLLAQLLNNAREAVGPGGRIGVSAQPKATEIGPGVEVRITDDGVGLSPEVQARLTREPFFTSKPRHRGLGLAMVRQVVRAHRGQFDLQPLSGTGAVACLWLPAASPSLPASLRGVSANESEPR